MVWNKGLTKETDERVRKYSEKRIAQRPVKVRIGETKKIMKNNIRKRDSHWAWKEYYGEFPEDGFIIHHKDGNEDNNSKENLMNMTRSNHNKLHWKLKINSQEVK